ncbi:hypothetical protein BGZ59_008809 [Podila verticillata]|nr:hypothetical protein BGZ59_008809 [Podila verticillata]
MASYPVSVAAMDKFKPLRTDTIPLKTFTYRETPVTEIKRPRALPTPSQKTLKVPSPTTSVSSEETQMEDVHPTDTVDLLDPLPRHLASRETRSNPDYLRMMASELQMIRARKLIAPLKPRGYLPRRRDAFRHSKSSLCVSIEMASAEEDHPLNSLFVGSWSSVSSTDSFLSTTSSDYLTADETFD